MLLTVTCEGAHVKGLGFLIHKNPASVFERNLAYGKLTLFYTENEPRRATVALICEVDPVSLLSFSCLRPRIQNQCAPGQRQWRLRQRLTP